MPQQQYTIHQLRYLSNTVLYALSARPLVDSRPDNPDNRYRFTASPVPKAAPTGTTIPETTRMLAISPEHAGLELPMTGVLLYRTQILEWIHDKDTHLVDSLDHAITQVRIAKTHQVPLPKLWHPVGHTNNGWFCRANYAIHSKVRGAALELLDLAIQAGNVKAVGRG